MTETWKQIQSAMNYEVSNLGRVRRIKSGRFLKPCANTSGYLWVVLYTVGYHFSIKLSRLVALNFVPRPFNKDYHLQVNHIDGNRVNDKAENLEWVTPLENIRHAERLGLRKSKLSEIQVQEIKIRLEKYSHGLMRQLATEYNVDPSMISRINDGTRR